MAITARTWVEGEVATAAKFNTIRDDLLELDAVAGFFDSQYGSITISDGNSTADATVSSMSSRAVIHFSGSSQNYTAGNIGASISKINATTIRAIRAGSANFTTVNYCISDPRG